MTQNYRTYDDLPLTLNPTDVAAALGISRVNAYNHCHSTAFPAIRLGKRILVPRDCFPKWLEEQEHVSKQKALLRCSGTRQKKTSLPRL